MLFFFSESRTLSSVDPSVLLRRRKKITPGYRGREISGKKREGKGKRGKRSDVGGERQRSNYLKVPDARKARASQNTM